MNLRPRPSRTDNLHCSVCGKPGAKWHTVFYGHSYTLGEAICDPCKERLYSPLAATMRNECEWREWIRLKGYVCLLDDSPCGTAETCRYRHLFEKWEVTP